MNVRGYLDRDRDACRALWAQMTGRHREIYEDPSIGGEHPELAFDRHLAEVGPQRIWVAERDGEIFGFVSLIHRGEEAEVEPIAVASGHRGEGIGRRLIERVVAEARSLGVLCLAVRPVARNREAISFFHRAGFRILGHVQLFQWLGPAVPGQWKPGAELFGMEFDF